MKEGLGTRKESVLLPVSKSEVNYAEKVDATFGLITFATVDLWWINVFIFSLYAKTA